MPVTQTRPPAPRRIVRPRGAVDAVPDDRDTPASRRLRRGTVAVAVAGVTVQTVAYLVNAMLLDGRFVALDLDVNGGIFTWASVLATALGVPALALRAALVPADWRDPIALGLILTFLSIDDFIEIHERFAELDSVLGLGSNGGRLVWPVIYLPLLGLGALLLVRIARDASLPTRRLLLAALGVLGLAIAFEFGSYALVLAGFDMQSWPFLVEIAIEESLELAGWLMFGGGLTALVAETVIRRGRTSAGPDLP